MSESQTTPSTESSGGPNNLVYQAIRSTAGMAGYVLKTLAVAILLLHFVWTFLTAGACFYLAYEGSIVRGILAATVGAALAGVTATFLVGQVVIWFGTRRLLSEAQIGTTIFNRIFEAALSRSGASADLGEKGLSIRETEEILKNAAKRLKPVPVGDTGNAEETSFAVLLFLAGLLQRAVVWATIKIVVKQCRVVDSAEEKINLNLLRDRLGPKIDGLIANYIKTVSSRVIYSCIGLASGLAVLAARLIRHIPI